MAIARTGTGGTAPTDPEQQVARTDCAAPSTEAAKSSQDAGVEASVSRMPTSAGPGGALSANLIRAAMDVAVPKPGHTPTMEDQLGVLFAGVKLYHELQQNPDAGKQFMEHALYQHDELVGAVKDYGKQLRENPSAAVLGGLTALADATAGHDLEAIEKRFSSILPRQHVQGRTSRRVGVAGRRAGRAETALGTFSGAVSGSAGARGEASGSTSVGIAGVQAQGKVSGWAGVEGQVDGRFRSALVDANVRLRGEASVYADAQGQMTANLKEGLRATGSAHVGATVRVEVDADFRTAGVTIGGQRVDVNGNVHGYVEASARAGVDAEVVATIRPPRALAVLQADAFVGVKAGVRGSVGIGEFVTLSGHADVWAGAGAEAGIIAGYDDGKLRFGFNLGAAVEVGAGAGWAIEIDIAAIGEALTEGTLDLAEGILDALNPFDDLFQLSDALGSLLGQETPNRTAPQLAILYPPFLGPDRAQTEADQQARRALEEIQRAVLALARRRAAAQSA